MKTDARTAAMKILLRLEEQEGYSNLALKKFFSVAEMEERERAFAETLVYGVLERRITLDYVIASNSKRRLSEISLPVLMALRLGAYQLLYLDKIPASAAINESVKAAKKFDGIQSGGFVNAVLHAIHRLNKEIVFPPEKNRKTYLSTKYSCPQPIVKLWCAAYGRELCEAILQESFGRPPMTVHVNTTRISADALRERLRQEGIQAEAHPFLPDALNLSETGAIEQSAAFREGLFHVQDAASQLCCALLEAKAGENIADVCAAPGGKSFTLAEQMQNSGTVAAFDLYPQRVRLIEEGAERLGLTCIAAAVRDAASEEALPAKFDRVLCDVPCSGLGVLRRKPEIRYKSPEGLDNLPEIQYRILERSAKSVRAGGVLMYSTCTLNPAENGEIANRFLAEHSDEWEAFPLKTEGFRRCIAEPENQMTWMPHIHGTDGFFTAGFRRKAEGEG